MELARLVRIQFHALRRSIRLLTRFNVAYLPFVECVVCLYVFVVFIALIIVPTRELALQTSQIAIELSKHIGLKVATQCLHNCYVHIAACITC